MRIIYEIPDKMVASTFFNAGFIVLAIFTVLGALAWIGFNKNKKFWKSVIIIFTVLIVVLWCVHFVTVFDKKNKTLGEYLKGNYYVSEGVIDNLETGEDGGSFDLVRTTVDEQGNEKQTRESFIFPHSSGYGFTGGDIDEGMYVKISYVIFNEQMSYVGDVLPKCIVRIELIEG